jgi:hypothetical protein
MSEKGMHINKGECQDPATLAKSAYRTVGCLLASGLQMGEFLLISKSVSEHRVRYWNYKKAWPIAI